MTSFENWFKELCSNYVWFQPASMQHEPKTFEDTARKVYMQYVASEHFPPIQEARRHVYNKLVLVPGDRKKVDWVKRALEKVEEEKKEEWKPVSWDKRAEYLELVQAEINKIDDKRIRPLLAGEAETNGQDDPPKPKAKCAPSAPVEVIVNHINKLNEARRKFFLERNPGASESEIEAYINKFDKI
jgi:hypothetical protein